MSSGTAPSLTFPHPVLTPVSGRPTNSSLQILQQQLYENARSIPSDRGDGINGHLSLIQPEAEYLARTNNVAFIVPHNPGVLAAPPPGATQAQLFEIKRVHEADSTAFTTYHAVRNSLVKQIVTALDPTFIAALKDVDFGFADVLPRDMLAHLKNTYGNLTGAEIEANRARMSDPWDPNSPIESLWSHITEVRRIATSVNQPIDDVATITLTLSVFRNTGLFGPSIDLWNSIAPADQTYALFVEHFTRANTTRLATLTTADVHFANNSTVHNNNPVPVINNVTPTVGITVGNKRLYYCWSHGLTTNSTHSSATCNHPKPGHDSSATAMDRKGGSNTFNLSTRPRRNNNNGGNNGGNNHDN
jgi:hypothetical protein